jgi:hypothetical protein
MIIVKTNTHSPQAFTKSIFLAGPTTRNNGEKLTEWRLEACEILKKKGYDGVVYIPEPFTSNLESQVNWENARLNWCDCVLFWVPRDLQKLPGFTTNIEFGEWMKSGKAVLGFPKGAPHTDYMHEKADKYRIMVSDTLEGTIDNALILIGDGAFRNKVETQIPIHVWNMSTFQQWYTNLKKVGNRLDDAKVEWAFRVTPLKVFFCILHAKVWIESEKRTKTNEVVLFRSDISTILAYKRSLDGVMQSKIVLVKEFRTPGCTEDGFVHELPGGSSFHPKKTILESAVDELEEEVGLKIDSNELAYMGTRQICATLSAHKAHLFSIELNEQQMLQVEELAKQTHGVKEDTEKTYVEIKTLEEIMKEKLLDWSMTGMIYGTLLKLL